LIDVISRTCHAEGCRTRPAFAKPGQTRGQYCAVHKTEEMIDVINRTCQAEGCRTGPAFAKPGQTRGQYCAVHKTEEMIDVISRTCQAEECRKRPAFAKPGDTRGQYCAVHALDNMINVSKKMTVCIMEGCRDVPLFNFKGKRPIYCQIHQQIEMINLEVSKKCAICQDVPLCQFQGLFYCQLHYPDRKAISKLNREDLLDTTCSECQDTPLCKLNDHLYCLKHYPDPDAIRKLNREDQRLTCSQCPEPPLCRLNGDLYCQEHYPDLVAISMLNKECKYCDLGQTDYVCQDCRTRRHRKEWDVVCQLRRMIPGKRPIHDSNRPVKECSRRRPDLFYDCGTHVVIVEVDENQHRDYQPLCECARISEIVGSIGGQPITIIRYNPDKILNRDQPHRVSKEMRLNLLVEIVRKELNLVPIKFEVKLIQLFYDQNDTVTAYQAYKEENITDIVAI